jgi:hypothetical protein
VKSSFRWAVAIAVFSSVAPLSHGDEFFFKDGDRVVMIGDSITEQHLYSNYVEMWTVSRFPHWKITFRNVGIGGDRSVGGNSRFERDVLLHKPTAMTVDFGMNDGSYREFSEQTFKPYMDGLQGMAEQAKKANIRTAWVTPQPLDNDEQGTTALTGYNQTLEKFSDGVKSIANKNNGTFVDQFHPYLAVLDSARSKGCACRGVTIRQVFVTCWITHMKRSPCAAEEPAPISIPIECSISPWSDSSKSSEKPPTESPKSGKAASPTSLGTRLSACATA